MLIVRAPRDLPQAHQLPIRILCVRLLVAMLVARESTVRVAPGLPVADTDFSTDAHYRQLEAVTLQRHQNAPQSQQNRIVKLVAVNQNKTKLPQSLVPIFYGNPVDYRYFVVLFGRLRV